MDLCTFTMLHFVWYGNAQSMRISCIVAKSNHADKSLVIGVLVVRSSASLNVDSLVLVGALCSPSHVDA